MLTACKEVRRVINAVEGDAVLYMWDAFRECNI